MYVIAGRRSAAALPLDPVAGVGGWVTIYRIIHANPLKTKGFLGASDQSVSYFKASDLSVTRACSYRPRCTTVLRQCYAFNIMPLIGLISRLIISIG